jgi:hypothetical protein
MYRYDAFHGLSRTCLSAICLWFAACVTSDRRGRARCDVSAPDAGAFTEVAHGVDLPEALRNVLTVLSRPGTGSLALDAAGLPTPHDASQATVMHISGCFSVARWSDEGSVVAFYLGRTGRNGRVGPEEFLMMATHDGVRWRFTWPAGIVPPNLGRE